MIPGMEVLPCAVIPCHNHSWTLENPKKKKKNPKTWLFSLKKLSGEGSDRWGFPAPNLKAVSQNKVEKRGISQIWMQEKSRRKAKIPEIDKTSMF